MSLKTEIITGTLAVLEIVYINPVPYIVGRTIPQVPELSPPPTRVILDWVGI
jgi:hypothetical protein